MGRNRRNTKPKKSGRLRNKLLDSIATVIWQRAEDHSNPTMRMPNYLAEDGGIDMANAFHKVVEVSSSTDDTVLIDANVTGDSLSEPYVPKMVSPPPEQLNAMFIQEVCESDEKQKETPRIFQRYIYTDRESFQPISNQKLAKKNNVERVSRSFQYSSGNCQELSGQIICSTQDTIRAPPNYTYSSYKDLKSSSITRGSKSLEVAPESTAISDLVLPVEVIPAATTFASPTKQLDAVGAEAADDDDEIVILDVVNPELEEGEIRSEDETTIQKITQVSRKLRRKLRPSHNTPVKVKTQPIEEITLDDTIVSLDKGDITYDDVTMVAPDQHDGLDDHDDCQVLAVVTTPNSLKADARRERSAKKREKFHGQNVVWIQRNQKPLTRRLSTPTRQSPINRKVNTKANASVLQRIAKIKGVSNPIRKRLRKSMLGTPLPQKRSVHNTSNLVRNLSRRVLKGTANMLLEDECRTGTHRKQPLLAAVTRSGNAQGPMNIQFFGPNVTGVVSRNGEFELPPCQLIRHGIGCLPRPVGEPRPIIIDGSNVAIGHGTSKRFSCRGLELCVKKIKETLPHREIVCFVPRFRHKPSQSTDTQILDRLESQGIVKFTASREVNGKTITSYDDRFILEYATASGGIVISNDNYKDLFQAEPQWRDTITNRLLQFTWVGDYLMFPGDPLGQNGPTLDQFCRFPPQPPQVATVSTPQIYCQLPPPPPQQSLF